MHGPGDPPLASFPGPLTKREDDVPAIQVSLPEGQQGTGPLGEEGGVKGVLEHEPDRSDEGRGVLGDGALQAANTFLKQDVANSWQCTGTNTGGRAMAHGTQGAVRRVSHPTPDRAHPAPLPTKVPSKAK